MGIKVYNKQVCQILNKWQKTEKLLFFLFDSPTLNANFK